MKAAHPSIKMARWFWAHIVWHALWLNGLWEAGQCLWFYEMGDALSAPDLALMLGATVADVFLTLILVGGALLFLKDTKTGSQSRLAHGALPVALSLVLPGAGMALLIEISAQAAGWWRYSEAMPLIHVSGFSIGVLPLLQMALLPLLCFRLTATVPTRSP